MPVDRLDARLDAVWEHRLGLVVAPAGSGKTTLLARFAARSASAVGWYRAEGWDRDESALVQHLEAAVAPALNGAARGWQTVADAANALASRDGDRLLVVIDDFHTLQGTPAEAALERLIEYAPPSLTFLIASRVPPAFNLPRLRVSGSLLELTGDDLRFRSWEVERLFHDFYEEPLPPEELAGLARRTEGWAAGLQLFHLATRGRTPDERRRLLTELGRSARLTREYLARNVLDQLPPDVRRFLIDTSVLGKLNGALCDRLLSTTGSADLLVDLVERRLFTQALAEDGMYRYHEVLRSHLQGVLLEEVGEDGLRDRFRAAGELLAAAGAVPEALEAFCRGEDWDRAHQILGNAGEAVADRASSLVDGLPPAIVLHDPWLLLASARRLRSEGRFREALERYGRAERAFGSSDPSAICRDEAHALATWLDDTYSARPDAFTLLRSAVRREPLSIYRDSQALPPPGGPIVAGLAALVAGSVSIARRELVHAAQRPDSGTFAQAVAALGAAVAGLLMGQRHATVEVEGAVAAAETAGVEWLARVGRASIAVTGSVEAIREADAVATTCAAMGDEWGYCLARLFGAWGSLASHREPPNLDELVVRLRALNAPALESWVRGIHALAMVRAGEPDSREAALSAEAHGRSTRVGAASLLADMALAEGAVDDDEVDEYRSIANAIAQETGLMQPGGGRPDVGPELDAKAPPVSIRVLGGFELKLAGRDLDLAGVRPRARILLRLLCLNAGTRVHHEAIESALWPDASADASGRNLHVAIAALRRAIEPASIRGSFQLLRREGDAYLFALPMGAEVDILRFEHDIASGRLARERGHAQSAARSFEQALDLYRGDVLPEDGPQEWIAERRESCRMAAVEAAQGLAEILLERGNAAGAARACGIGLRIERYHDPLWRLLIRARDEAGDKGAASRARLGYDQMLADLGVERGATGSSLI